LRRAENFATLAAGAAALAGNAKSGACHVYAEILVDIKGLEIGESSDHASFRAEQGQLKPADRRAVKVHKEYKAAKDLDSKYHHTPGDENSPVKYRSSFGPATGKYEGTVHGLGIGCFGGLSAGFNDVCTFIARNRA